MRKDARREDVRPLEIPDVTAKVPIENVTFSSSDARFLQTNRNKYTSTMPSQIKGLENSEAMLAYKTWGALRGALLEGGMSFMKAKAKYQTEVKDPADAEYLEMQGQLKEIEDDFKHIDDLELKQKARGQLDTVMNSWRDDPVKHRKAMANFRREYSKPEVSKHIEEIKKDPSLTNDIKNQLIHELLSGFFQKEPWQ